MPHEKIVVPITPILCPHQIGFCKTVPLYPVISRAGQLFGAAIGAWLIECSTEQPMQRGLGSHDLAQHVSSGQGCLVELMLTFILVFVIFGVAVDRRGPGMLSTSNQYLVS